MNDGRALQTAATEAPALGRTDTPRAEFTHRVLVVVGIVTLTAAAGAVFVKASDIFFLFFAAILLAVLLHSASNALDRRTKLGPRWSFGLLMFALAAALAVGAYWVGSLAVVQFNQLVADMPKSVEQARAYVREQPWGQEVLRQAPTAEELVTGGEGNAASHATRFFSTSFGVLGNLLVLTFLTLYLAGSPRLYVDGLLRLVPPAPRRGRSRC